jgi:uncharacterized membrane protein
MAKMAFLIGFTCIHAFIACAAGILSFMTVFNMCGPARPATTLTHVSGAVSLIMLCPLGLPSFWLAETLNQDWLVPAGILANSYCWGLGAWRLWRRR